MPRPYLFVRAEHSWPNLLYSSA